MAEIKLNESFKGEVDAFRTSTQLLDTVNIYLISTEELELPTVDAYQERLARIRKLIVSYSALVHKDADDMDALAARLKAADNKGGGVSGGGSNGGGGRRF